MKATKVNSLNVRIYENRLQMGVAAAKDAAAQIKQLLNTQETLNIIFAAAPSQNEFLAALLQEDVAWERINAFHMDEYLSLPQDAPQLFGVFLKDKIFGKAPFKEIFYLNGQTNDTIAESKRYTTLLEQYPTDIVFMGIGENTHLAFNDPHVADFNDPYLVKTVDLDDACKQQQVNDGCFDHPDRVPTHAFTLTIPALFKAKYLYCMVPGKNKAQAVYHTLTDVITEKYPSTILRTHAHATLYLDQDSAALIESAITVS
ncbi:MAG: glucosamine-6-phosphate deaminase [Chitinophagaceae bacterium]